VDDEDEVDNVDNAVTPIAEVDLGQFGSIGLFVYGPKYNPLYIFIALIILVNIAGAIYLYRKKSHH